MKLGFTYLLVLLLLCTNGPLFGQDRRVHEVDGTPFNTHRFVDESTGASNENWQTIQHPNGLLYVANQSGVLEYDGHTWRVIELPEKNSVFSLDIDEEGVVYVGARGDFGKLVPGPAGVLQYESMLEHVNDEERDFLNVWGIHSVSDGIIFQTNKYLFRWDGKRLDSWKSDHRLHTSFSLFDRVFVKKDGVGLLELSGDSLHHVPEGESFADHRVFMMEPLRDGSIMIGSQVGIDGPLQLFKLSESGVSKMIVDPHFTDMGQGYTYYKGTTLRDNYLAIASLYDGVFIVDTDGHFVEALGADRSIPNDVLSVYKDLQGGLWLSHYTSGITHIGAPFSLSEYDLPGNLVNDIVRFKGNLYIATDEGLFTLGDRRMVEESDPTTQFDTVYVEGISKMRFSLLPFEDQLLVATMTGVFSLVDGKPSLVAFTYRDKPKSLFASKKFPDRVYVGMETGLGVMTMADSGWEWEVLDNANQPITSLAEAADGSFWFTRKATSSQVWKMTFDESGKVQKEVFVIDDEEFDSNELEVELIGGQMAVTAAAKGIFRIKEDKDQSYTLFLDSQLNGSGASPDSLKYAFSVDENNYWAVYPNKLVLSTIREDGSIDHKDHQILEFSSLNSVDNVFVDNDQVIWLADKDRLLKFKPHFAYLDETDHINDPMIRSVSFAWSDSVIYAGNYFNRGDEETGAKDIQLIYKDNDLEFEFATPDFYRLGAVEYSYMIKGVESTWSEWTTDNRVVYRNIDPGKHEIMVRARSGDTYYETEAQLPFSILAPWYATWWMKVVYACLSLAGILFVMHFVNAKKQLVLFEREREWYDRIRLANEQLRTANSSLEEANRMKDEFLANASHELRTPLTAILGFTSVLKEELLDEHQEFVGLIDENGKRLLKTINSLLDLAKLKAGTVELKLKPLDVNAKVEKVVDMVAQLAKNRSIELNVKKSQSHIYALLDEDSFERVLYNLIGNAIKFTPEGSVEIDITSDQNQVSIEIQDTGIGIDDAFIPFLFDEFKQEPSVEVHSDGSGLGLAISSKLIDMMGGEIYVTSQKGVGSTFSVKFPVEHQEYINREKEKPGDKKPETPTQSTI